MKAKKFLSMVLALAMIFTLSVSVFAEGEQAAATNDKEFKADATVVIPAIDVTVPTTGEIFINPMGFTLNVSGTNKGKTATAAEASASDAAVTTSDSQVASPIYYIKNSSPMNLEVSVSPLATVDAGAKALSIASTSDLSASTKNEVFIYALFVDEENEDTTVNGFDPNMLDVTPAYTKDGENGAVAVPAKALKEPVVVGTVLKISDDNTPVPGAMSMRFFGSCSAQPKTDWNNGDKVSVTMTFTFKPVPDASDNG